MAKRKVHYKVVCMARPKGKKKFSKGVSKGTFTSLREAQKKARSGAKKYSARKEGRCVVKTGGRGMIYSVGVF